MKLLYSVFVKELEFYGYHGVSEEERSVGNRFRVTLSVDIDQTLPSSDNVLETVDYGQLAQSIVTTSNSKSYKTVETLAADCCRNIMDQFALVTVVDMELEKLAPPFPHVVASAGVTVTVHRGDQP